MTVAKDTSWFEFQAAMDDLTTLLAIQGDDTDGGEPPPDWLKHDLKEAALALVEHLGPADSRKGDHDQSSHGRALAPTRPGPGRDSRDSGEFRGQEFMSAAQEDLVGASSEKPAVRIKQNNVNETAALMMKDEGYLRFLANIYGIRAEEWPAWRDRNTAAEHANEARGFVDTMQRAWAKSASDDSPHSIAMQMAVANKFGIPEDISWESAHWHDSIEKGRKEYTGGKPAYDAYASAVYENTQAKLKRAGITEVTLYRGLAYSDKDLPTGLLPDNLLLGVVGQKANVEVGGNPVASWTSWFGTAQGFAKADENKRYGVVLSARVPAERIWSTARSGPGCLDETEWLVIGGPQGVRAEIVTTMRDWEADPVNNYGGFPPVSMDNPIEKYLAKEAVIDVRPHLRTVGGKPVQVRGHKRTLPDLRPAPDSDAIADAMISQSATGKENDLAALGDSSQRAQEWAEDRVEYESHYEKVQAAGMVKRQNVLDLTEMMEDDPEVKAYGAGTFTVSDFIDERQRDWAETSSDKAFRQIALQYAVAQEFGADPSIVNDSLSDEQLKHVTWNSAWMLTQEMVKDQAATYYKDNQVLLHSFARNVYDNTQKKLAAAGVSEVVLYRGMVDPRVGYADSMRAGPQTVHMNPLSSWSLSEVEAKAFAGDSGVVLSARVPAARIWSTARSGPGCLHEQEFIVLGGRDERVRVTMYGSGL